MYSFSTRQFIWEYIGDFIFWRESSLMYSFSIRQFIWEYIGDLFFLKSSGVQKINKAQMVDFLTKSFKKMPKNKRAKGVALKSPDIKIIMYVCTPLNKVFGFQGSKILVVN